jgi:hypothetical protein
MSVWGFLGPMFSLEIAGIKKKRKWKQDSDLASLTTESNLLVIISWLWFAFILY